MTADEVAHAARETVRFAGFCGMPPAQLQHLAATAEEAVLIARVCPHAALGTVRCDVVEVPRGCRELADLRRGATSDARAAFADAVVFDAHWRIGNRVGTVPALVEDPADALWSALPAIVRRVMMANRERVLVAGGFVLSSLLADDDVRAPDVDVFIVGCHEDVAAADAIVSQVRSRAICSIVKTFYRDFTDLQISHVRSSSVRLGARRMSPATPSR